MYYLYTYGGHFAYKWTGRKWSGWLHESPKTYPTVEAAKEVANRPNVKKAAAKVASFWGAVIQIAYDDENRQRQIVAFGSRPDKSESR